MDRWLDEWKEEFVKLDSSCIMLCFRNMLFQAINGTPSSNWKQTSPKYSFSERYSEKDGSAGLLSMKANFTITDFPDQIRMINVLILWSPARQTIHVNACFIT